MTKYIIMIDYKANFKPMTIDFEELQAQNIVEAMEEANAKWHEGIYMMAIYEKTGKQQKVEGCSGWMRTRFIPAIERRSYGWNPAGDYTEIHRDSHKAYGLTEIGF